MRRGWQLEKLGVDASKMSLKEIKLQVLPELSLKELKLQVLPELSLKELIFSSPVQAVLESPCRWVERSCATMFCVPWWQFLSAGITLSVLENDELLMGGKNQDWLESLNFYLEFVPFIAWAGSCDQMKKPELCPGSF